MDSSKTNVLVTCGGGLQGMTVYKSLQALDGAASHLFDCNEENVSKYFYDEFFRSSPVSHEKKYEEELAGYCREYNIKLVVPATQFDLLFLSRRKREFQERLNCRLAVPDKEYVEAFSNKITAKAFLKEKGFPVQERRNPFESEHYPLIGKPIHGWGGRGVVVLKKPVDFHPYKDKRDDYLWTDHIKDFREYSIDFAVDHQGHISPPLVRERQVVSGGFALVSQRVTMPEQYVSLIMQGFSYPNFSGIYNLQYISSGEGDFFTDLNPRIGTSAVWGNWMAFNPIAHLLGISTREKLPDPAVRVIRYLEEKYVPAENHRAHGQRLNTSWDTYSMIERVKEEVRKERNIEIGREMKSGGLPVAQITRFTGLSQEEVEKL